MNLFLWEGHMRGYLTNQSRLLVGLFLFAGMLATPPRPLEAGDDFIREIQERAVAENESSVMYWGTDPEQFSTWTSHSNRLVPVYTFGTKGGGAGIDLASYQGENSPYRSEEALKKLYGKVPDNTLNGRAEYFDQANLGEIQIAALKAGKKHVFLVVFDGMDWQTTFAAATYKSGKVAYESGRGTGLHFQDYEAQGTTQFGMVVAAPHNDDAKANVDTQEVTKPGGLKGGGYNARLAGPYAWSESEPEAIGYLIGKSKGRMKAHPVPDSSATATTLCTGIKTYNSAIGVGPTGEKLTTVAHLAQEQGLAVGVISSVPISHATPASAYAHNVDRDDYQDLSRDLLGLPSISHPEMPLAGMDVVIGSGWGTDKESDAAQGKNFVPGNRYLAEADRKRIDVANGGRYHIVQRTPGESGQKVLQKAADNAAKSGQRLFGYFGVAGSAHLPFRTADGNYDPVKGIKNPVEIYSKADIHENPTLADMTEAGLTVLAQNPKGFWLMVESGDVDWANHDNQLDNSIGAVISGDDAIRSITSWVEKHSNWQESLLIVTADHGHYLHIKSPAALAGKAEGETGR
jgi:alkaline phosphatase